MRKQTKSNFGTNELITLKNHVWLELQKHAGRCVASVLVACASALKQRSPLSLKDLEVLALLKMQEFDCTPTFQGYRGFPSGICTSVNEQVVHGIATEYVLQGGDLVTVDVGATYKGAIADAARTWIYGEPKDKRHVQLVKAGREALDVGTKAVQVGKQVGAIGYAIYKFVNSGLAPGCYQYGLVTKYGGHGLDYNKPHADPFIHNKSESWDGARIVPGLAIAIEPMLVLGESGNWDVQTKTLNDGWTVVTKNLNCHFENSVTVMEDGIHIITETNET